MDVGRRDCIPADFALVCKRFEHSRRIRKARSRIPEPLWDAAVEMAGRYGIHLTAKALRVDYYSLKKRLERGAPARLPSPAKAATAFIELPPLTAVHSDGCVSQCTLEWEDAGGGTLRLHLPGIAAADLATVCRSLRP
jgi:hypothetical protein